MGIRLGPESRLQAPGAGSPPRPAIGIVSEGVTQLLTRGRSIATRGDERFLSGRGGAHPWHKGTLSVVGESTGARALLGGTLAGLNRSGESGNKESSKMAPEEFQSEEEDESSGATSDPLAEPPGSRGRKAPNPYEGTEAGDEPGPSLIDQLEDHTPAADEQLDGGEEN